MRCKEPIPLFNLLAALYVMTVFVLVIVMTINGAFFSPGSRKGTEAKEKAELRLLQCDELEVTNVRACRA